MCCSQYIKIEERAKMPTCNLAEIVHNKWLQRSGNKLTCLYTATVDDMIRAFMQIANYRTWWTTSSCDYLNLLVL